MYMKTSEFKAIQKILCNQNHHYTPEGKHFDNLPEEMQQEIVEAEVAMMQILKRHKAQNKTTASYIAGKRKENKNYAR